MKYLERNIFNTLKDGQFLTQIKQQEYSKYINLPYVEGDETNAIKAKLAVIIRNKDGNKLLWNCEEYFVKQYDIVTVPGEDYLKYPILLKSLADNFMNEFNGVDAKQLINGSFPVALGVARTNDTIYYVFDFLVDEELLKKHTILGSSYMWINNESFTFSTKLDTIILPRLKFVK